jgi:predicted nicotinamide N-methyase
MSSLESFHAAYDAEPVEMTIAGRSYRIFTPRTIERFLQDAGTLNGFPLWARIWPASIVLAEMVASMPVVPGSEWIEIGGGLGQVSIVAAARGHRITLSEANPHALAFARASAELNGLPQLPVVQLDWGGRSIPGAFDVIIGSELVYRDADIIPLQHLFTRLLKPAGRVILAGELRRTSDGFLRRMAESFHVQVQHKRLRSGPQSVTVLVFRMHRKSQH